MKHNCILFLFIGGILLLACQISGNLSSVAPTPTAKPTITQTIPQPTPTGKATTPPALPVCTVSTNVENGVLHIRACPGISCRVVGYAYEGRAVQVRMVKNHWAWIGAGWVYSDFLECGE